MLKWWFLFYVTFIKWALFGDVFFFFKNTYEVVDSLEGKKNLPSVIQHVLIHSVHEECSYWTQTVSWT